MKPRDGKCKQEGVQSYTGTSSAAQNKFRHGTQLGHPRLILLELNRKDTDPYLAVDRFEYKQADVVSRAAGSYLEHQVETQRQSTRPASWTR
jgi:hypothetical protein